MNSERVWKPIGRDSVGYLTDVSPYFEKLELENPGCFPNLRAGTDIVAASDYSGEHKTGFCAFSFVFVDWNASEQWSVLSSEVRERFLSQGNREMEYKKLKNDAYRRAALKPFLEAADHIQGMVFTLVLSKQVNSVLEAGGIEHLRSLFPDLAKRQASTIEKLYRVETLLALMLAGLCRSDQPVYWITDDDEIVGDAVRLRTAHDMLSSISKHHFGHELRLMEVGTVDALEVKAPTGFAMDLCAIADLVGGAILDAWNAEVELGRNQSSIPTLSQGIPDKARVILEWLRQAGQPLKRMSAVIDLSGVAERPLNFRWLQVH